MFSRRSLPFLLRLALLALALVVIIVGLVSVLARTVPRFNRYIPLVPPLKPFRYSPPEPGEPERAPSRPSSAQVDTRLRGRLGEREVRTVEVSVLGAPWPFEEDEQHIVGNRYRELPAVSTRSFTGAAAQELAELWDSQSLDCTQPGALCFWPSYRLRFFERDGAILTAYLCWSCSRAELTLAQQSQRCRFAAATPEARQLKHNLRSLLPPLSTSREWELPGDTEREPDSVPPPAPVTFESISTSLPAAAELMQSELQRHQRALAYCYEQRLTVPPWPEGQLLVEYDLGAYTPVEHAARLERDRAPAMRSKDVPPSALRERLELAHSTVSRPIRNLTLIRSTIADPTLTQCALDSMQSWHLRRRTAPGPAPLHTRVTITFRIRPPAQTP